jgi:hypothetical protein
LSGYLQRLVLSARHAGTVRPMLGSIFAGAQKGGLPGSLEQEVEPEEGAAPHLRPHAPEPPPRRASAPDVPLERTAAPSAYIAPHAGDPYERNVDPVAAEKAMLRALVPNPRPEIVNVPAPHSAEPASHKPNEPAQPVPEPAPRELKIERLMPLMPLNMANLRSAAPLPAPVARPTGSSPDRPSKAATSRDPEEIQIHIGRIEVTAAPPAPVRVTPKPARKSPDLQAYLDRRGPRSR